MLSVLYPWVSPLWRRSLRGCGCGLTCELDPANWRPLMLPPPSLECIIPLSPQWEPFARRQPWESKVVLRPSRLAMGLNPVKVSMYVLRFWREMQRMPRLAAAQDNPRMWVPLLVKTATFSSLEWFNSFLDLALPSGCGGQFTNQHSSITMKWSQQRGNREITIREIACVWAWSLCELCLYHTDYVSQQRSLCLSFLKSIRIGFSVTCNGMNSTWHSSIVVLLGPQTICSPRHQNRLGLAVNTNSALSTFFILSVWSQDEEWWSFFQRMGILRIKITLAFSKYWWRARTRDKSGASSSWPSSSSPRAGMEISRNHHFKLQKVTLYEQIL